MKVYVLLRHKTVAVQVEIHLGEQLPKSAAVCDFFIGLEYKKGKWSWNKI